MNENVFQTCVDCLMNLLPDGWKRMSFYHCYCDDGNGFGFYVDLGEGFFFYLDKYNYSREVVTCFGDVAYILGEERKKLDDKDKWTSMVMILDNEGAFKVNYCYEKMSSNEHRKMIENKYLGL